MVDDDRQLAELNQELYEMDGPVDEYDYAEKDNMTATNEIAKALAAAQGEMKNPAFDTTNPHYRNKFASLASVRNATVPTLAKHGIAVVQDLTTVEGAIACTTRLYHASGQTLTFGPLVMPATKQDAQGLGSAATYCKRYSLMAVCGVVGDEDDDGNAAVSNGHDKTEPTITEKQATDLYALATEVGANIPAFLKYFGVEGFNKIPASRYHDAVTALEKKRQAA
jgi:hypothetical protein